MLFVILAMIMKYIYLSIYLSTQCHKSYSEGTGLRQHIQSAHEGVKFACDQCNYQATQQHDLTKHIQRQHEGVSTIHLSGIMSKKTM